MEEVGVVVDVLQGGAGDDQLEDGPVKVGLLGRTTGLTLKLNKVGKPLVANITVFLIV